MNYIAEINSFYDWLETNPVSDSAILLWHALMHVNNKTGWKVEFAVAISTLELKTSLSKSSILRARNTLQQFGRLTFKSRDGQQSAIYHLIAFHGDTQSDTQSDTQTRRRSKVARQTDTQTVTQTVTQSGAQTVTQTVPIPKLNKTKRNETDSVPNGTGAAAASAADSKTANRSEQPIGDKEKSCAKKERAKRGKKDVTPHWQALIKTWDEFYAKHFPGFRPTFDGAAQTALKSIAERIQKHTAESERTAGVEWTEDYAVKVFAHFLTLAIADEWRKQEFRLPVLSSHYDSIVKNKPNEQRDSKGAAGSGRDTDYERQLAERARRAAGQSG